MEKLTTKCEKRIFIAKYFKDRNEAECLGETIFEVDIDLEDVFAWFVRWEKLYVMPDQASTWVEFSPTKKVNQNYEWLEEPNSFFYEDDPENDEVTITYADSCRDDFSRADGAYLARTQQEADEEFQRLWEIIQS